ncbi:MAG: hypothetical protein ACRC6N_02790, partial [Plesiomonas sp.]|uniref:hypothetical protein n=1 Tax=Plesiomonas sp. TaxID=2486279 RepID=UPI003F2CD663
MPASVQWWVVYLLALSVQLVYQGYVESPSALSLHVYVVQGLLVCRNRRLRLNQYLSRAVLVWDVVC